MSKTRLTAAPLWRIPISSSRVRKVFPVPLLPKTPLLRVTSSGMSRHSFVSMSKGLPIQKCCSSSEPNMSWMSCSEAREPSAKWGGTVLAGCGPSTAAKSSLERVSDGSTAMAPYAIVPETTLAMKGSDTSGGASFRPGSVEARDTSVTTPKNRIRSPCRVTKAPTFTSSVETPESSLTSTPSVREPDTTMPSRLAWVSLSTGQPLEDTVQPSYVAAESGGQLLPCLYQVLSRRRMSGAGV